MAFGVWQTIGGDLSGLWFVFIGWYLQGAASSQLEQQKLATIFAQHRVSEAMNRSYVLIPAEMPLQYLIDNNMLAYWQRAFVTQKDDSIIGMLSWHEIQAIPRERWQATTAAQAMVSLAQLHAVGLDTELKTAVEEMSRDGAGSLPVVANGRILGTISREDVTWFLKRAQAARASA